MSRVATGGDGLSGGRAQGTYPDQGHLLRRRRRVPRARGDAVDQVSGGGV